MSAESVLRDWRERGRLERLGGLSCFVIDTGAGDIDRPPLLWLHGFPSSSLDWRSVIDRLPEDRHLLMDFPGFGFSDKPDAGHYGYSLVEQADRVLLMLARHGVSRVRLVAHDMGTSVACELLARRALGLLPITIERLVLCNGSVYIEQSKLTPSQKILRSPLAGLYARIARWPSFRWQIGRILGLPLPEEELRAMWEGLRHNEGLKTLPLSIRYVEERYRFYERWTRPLESLDVPTRIVWGRKDPVAVPAIAERLAVSIPGSELRWLERCGHFPMLEDPDAYTKSVSDFLESA